MSLVKTAASIFALGTVALHLFCGEGPVAGPSTEEGNPQIVAVVMNKSAPVAGATVAAYRVADNTDSVQAPLCAVKVAEGVSDGKGRCAFDQLPEGNYSIKANDAPGVLHAFRSGITVGDSTKPVIPDTLILSEPGEIRGVVTRGGMLGNVVNQNLRDAAIMVIVQEITLSAITPENGTYGFTGLPAGKYTILYYATNGFYSSRKTVWVVSGQPTIVDTVVLKSLTPQPQGLEAIPDSVGLTVRLSWNKVDYSDLRGYEIERIHMGGKYGETFTTPDTSAIDSIAGVPAGTLLNYVVRAIYGNFTRSPNSLPVEMRVPPAP